MPRNSFSPFCNMIIVKTRKFCTRMCFTSVFLKDLSVCCYIGDSTASHTKKKNFAFIFLYLLHINNTVRINRKCVLKLQFFCWAFIFFTPFTLYLYPKLFTPFEVHYFIEYYGQRHSPLKIITYLFCLHGIWPLQQGTKVQQGVNK